MVSGRMVDHAVASSRIFQPTFKGIKALNSLLKGDGLSFNFLLNFFLLLSLILTLEKEVRFIHVVE